MPSYTSLINSLLRLFPSEKASQYYKAVQKLHPQSEPLSSAQLTRLYLDDQLDGWLTRHAWEACRGWNWPFWINAQMNPASSLYGNIQRGPLMRNQAARDAAPIPGIPDVFCGTVDRRGMVTPPHGQFSVETWFRFPDGVLVPAKLLSDNELSIEPTHQHVRFSYASPYGDVSLSVSACQIDDLQYIHLRTECSPASNEEECPVSIYFSVRPYTLESVVPVHDLVYNSKGFWMSDSRVIGFFPSRPDICWAGDARHGDAAFFINDPPERTAVRCPAGMATAISGWHLPLRSSEKERVEMILPLHPANPKAFPFVELVQLTSSKRGAVAAGRDDNRQDWAPTFKTHSPTDHLLEMSQQHLRSLVDISETRLHHQFLRRSGWLTAAVKALLYQGNREQAARLLQLPSLDIQKNGYLAMAAGKWSLQGQFLTAVADYHRLSQTPADRPVLRYSQLRNVARWIMRKRREIAHAPEKPQGLLPPGATRSSVGAEYQLVDNLWALQGIYAASWLARFFNEHRDADVLQKEAAKFTANLSAAIHREIEYSLVHQLPARLHRVFDSGTASEILEIVLMPDVLREMRAEDWLERLVNYLLEPLDNQTIGSRYTLRRVDEQGVYPARRMLLCMTAHKLKHPEWKQLYKELELLQTPLGIWPECIHPVTNSGCGQDMMDVNAAALYTVLVRNLFIQETEGSITVHTEWLPSGDDAAGSLLDLLNAPTLHGRLSAAYSETEGNGALVMEQVPDDPAIELLWSRGTDMVSLGFGREALGTHSHKLAAFTNNPGR